uniref:Uncharacterized protein n=1 Tax=Rhizophora mucronata TaxID=61149 RepID=A0A2P2Q108_RHIMU
MPEYNDNCLNYTLLDSERHEQHNFFKKKLQSKCRDDDGVTSFE